MASNLPWLRSTLNHPFKEKKLNNALRRWKMWGLCKRKAVLIPGDVRIVSKQWTSIQTSGDENGELQLRQCSPNVFGWAAWSWRTGVIVLQLAAALRSPRRCLSWQDEKRRHNEDRPSHPALSRLLCHFSQRPQLYSAAFHKGCCCCRALSGIVWC